MPRVARWTPPSILPALLLLAATAHGTIPPNFQYGRPITPSGIGEACAILDPSIFPHAAPALRDLRLFSADPVPVEVPYVLTVSEAQQTDPDPARIINLHRTGETLDFDLAMPARPYTEVVLDLAAQNFLAIAEVTGLTTTPGASPTPLGQFTLFDLTAQHLSRNTTLALQESTFPILHVRLHFQSFPSGRAAPHLSSQIIRAATVPPSREQQVLFETAVATRPQIIGRATVARFTLPGRLPIERILFRVAPGYARDFLRTVRINAQPIGSDAHESATGSIARVHRDIDGIGLRQEKLSVDATIGANLQGPAELTVTVENGADTPVPLVSVALQVRQRRLCFTARGDLLTLAYGDPDLRAPRYNSPRSLSAITHVVPARIGQETINPRWQAHPEAPRSHRRQPHLVWVVLLGLAGLFGIVAVRASRIVSHERH